MPFPQAHTGLGIPKPNHVTARWRATARHHYPARRYHAIPVRAEGCRGDLVVVCKPQRPPASGV